MGCRCSHVKSEELVVGGNEVHVTCRYGKMRFFKLNLADFNRDRDILVTLKVETGMIGSLYLAHDTRWPSLKRKVLHRQGVCFCPYKYCTRDFPKCRNIKGGACLKCNEVSSDWTRVTHTKDMGWRVDKYHVVGSTHQGGYMTMRIRREDFLDIEVPASFFLTALAAPLKKAPALEKGRPENMWVLSCKLVEPFNKDHTKGNEEKANELPRDLPEAKMEPSAISTQVTDGDDDFTDEGDENEGESDEDDFTDEGDEDDDDDDEDEPNSREELKSP